MSEVLPSCSIIVPTYDRPSETIQLLGSLVGQIRSSDQVLVVDDGSARENWDLLFQRVRLLKVPNIQLLRSKHFGVSGARNIGIDQAKNRLLMFTDSDCLANRDWVSRIKKTAIGMGAVQGNYWSQEVFSRLDGQHMLWRKVVSEARRKKFPASFGVNARNFAIWRSVLIDACGANPFDTTSSTPGGEDILLGRKLLARGIEVVMVDDAAVLHRGDSSSLTGLMRQKFQHGKVDALSGVLAPDTFGYGNFARAVLLPMRYGVSPSVSMPLWIAYTSGAAFGNYSP